MSKFGNLYIEGNSIFHRMNPIVKMLMFILWSIVVFLYMDIRVSLLLVLLGILLLHLSRVPYKIIIKLFFAVIVFNIINAFFILIISPEFGIKLAGHETILFSLFGYHIYTESIMYVLVLSLKYLSLLPAAIIFIFTTYPTEFACSLNRVGLSYRLAYTLNLMFRYLPEVKTEFTTIANAQAARGITFGRGEPSLIRRAKNLFSVIVPLINSSLDRIDKITHAMELRSFGKKRVRTWYRDSSFSLIDAFSLLFMLLLFVFFLYLRSTLWKNFNYKI